MTTEFMHNVKRIGPFTVSAIIDPDLRLNETCVFHEPSGHSQVVGIAAVFSAVVETIEFVTALNEEA